MRILQGTLVYLFLLTFSLGLPLQSYGQSCPSPTSFTTLCTSGSGTCGVVGSGNCDYELTFALDFSGNKKSLFIEIYVDGAFHDSFCSGEMAGNSTSSFTVLTSAPCGSDMYALYYAYGSSSNPCTGSTCDDGYCVDGTCASGILPVVIKSFDVKMEEGGDVLVDWSTTSEVSNSHFLVQKSIDGISWSDVGFIHGKGDQTSEASYRFEFNPGPFEEMYVRLLQVDDDGKQSILGLDQIYNRANTHLFIYDNGNRSIILDDKLLADNPSIHIFDMFGRLVYELKQMKQKSVDLSALPNGVYVARVKYGNTTQVNTLSVL